MLKETELWRPLRPPHPTHTPSYRLLPHSHTSRAGETQPGKRERCERARESLMHSWYLLSIQLGVITVRYRLDIHLSPRRRAYGFVRRGTVTSAPPPDSRCREWRVKAKPRFLLTSLLQKPRHEPSALSNPRHRKRSHFPVRASLTATTAQTAGSWAAIFEVPSVCLFYTPC